MNTAMRGWNRTSRSSWNELTSATSQSASGCFKTASASGGPQLPAANALSPAKVIAVEIFEDEKASRVIVPDYQLSLAIGREGQNARLAAKLTGWKIDIKSETQALMLQGDSEEE